MEYLYLIIGLILVLVGANYLVDGATAVAKRFGISDMVIGMTIVGIGTSTPEMVVSFWGAAQGNADIAVGNIVGSNICNILLILGISALIYPLVLTRNNIIKDIPFVLLSTAALCAVALDKQISGAPENIISLGDGIVLLLFFAVFIVYSFLTANKPEPEQDKIANQEVLPVRKNKKWKRTWLPILMIIGGLVTLIAGGDMFVNAATKVAKDIGVSDVIIAVTIVAIGTSVPELATSVIAATKKNTGLALGNVVGSNIFNVFLILGGSALITPLNLGNFGMINFMMLCVATLALFICAFTFRKRYIDRIEGVLFLLMYIAYIVLLVNGF
ncbi:MAG: calcium/sodium antiporter [Bacteroidales bacterium]|jgi:K+-dependent Na+/Ca+ exchanger related-protein